LIFIKHFEIKKKKGKNMVSILNEDQKEKRNIQKNSRDIVHFLSVDIGERTLEKYNKLNQAKEFIRNRLKSSVEPIDEKYSVKGKEVANIIAEIRGYEQPENIIIIGAHYDTVENSPGADDNASSIAALLELFRLLSRFKFKKTVRFAAFTLEEPPFFSTEFMGSMKHAENCRKKMENIELMISMDMLGFSCKKCKQEFPLGCDKNKYPKSGDFITVISFPSDAEYAYLWKKIYNKHSKHKIFELIGPASIPGIALSDHSSFTKHGFHAILLTDTAFYRNKNYHMPSDTFDSINFKFLAENIINLFIVIKEILNMEKLID